MDGLGWWPEQALLYGILGNTAIVACSLTGVIALPPPRVADMVRDDVGKVNEPPLAAPVRLGEVNKLEPGEVKKNWPGRR